MVTWTDFEKIDMRIGTVITADKFEEAFNPAYKLTIDFGTLGVKKSSAQITKLYHPKDLIDKQIIAVVNFRPKQIANMMSECLVLGAVGDSGEVTLIGVDKKMINGTKIG